jgi:hypothetical protein
VTFAEYQALPGVNWSTLKHMAKSPKHYLCEKAPPPYVTAAMIKGRAGHTATLEPDLFGTEYVVFPGARRAGKEWDAFEAQNEGRRTILKTVEAEQAWAMSKVVRAHPFAGPLLAGGEAEVSIQWVDEETGLACKGRMDYLRPRALIDLKTSADLDRRRFSMRAMDLAYHAQLSFYLRGLKALGREPVETYMIAVESAEPYDVACFTMDPAALEIGDALVSELLNKLAECEATKQWPGRYPGVETFYLPRWAYSDDEGANDVGLIIGGNSEAA